MKTPEVFSYLNHAYGASQHWITENPRYVKIGLAAGISFVVIGSIYRRLHQSDVLPFDNWKITLGLVSRPQVAVNPEQLSELVTRYSPTQLASGMYGYLVKASPAAPIPENPQTPKEWLTWIGAHFNQKDQLLAQASDISPAYQERHQLSAEDVNSIAIQTWTTTVQQWLALLGWNTLSMSENLLNSLRSSPRLAYTILFHFTASYVTTKIWESIEDPLPEPLARVKEFYLNHKISIALTSLAVVGFLFYRMKQEKGILKNLTQALMTFQRGHKRYDQISSYNRAVNEVLHQIGKTAPGEKGSNIIWTYQKKAHMTFGEEIGEALAERAAAGKVYGGDLTPDECPHLKNLQVFELDLEEFLTEYRNVDAVFQGWNDTMKHIAEAGNVVVVLKGLSVIGNRMFPQPHQRGDGGGGYHEEGGKASKILTSLVTLALQQGKFRCLMVLDEQENERLKQEFDFLFTQIKAPDMSPKEMEDAVARLYASPETGQSLPSDDVHQLFNRMKFVLDKTPFAPENMIVAIKDGQKTWEKSWRQDKGKADQVKNIQKAEKDLQEVQFIKEQLLQKRWELKFAGKEEPLSLVQALVMLEKVLLPLYTQAVVDSKKRLPSAEQPLLTSIQKKFNRFFGPCMPEEHQRLLALPGQLKEKIRGQDLALEDLGQAIEKWRVVPTDDGKPLVLFLAGPPAAGKTQTATELAFRLNGVYGIADSVVQTQESNIKRFSLNREQQGAFLGWDIIKVQILEFIYQTPACVIVFEEWDKMGENDRSSLLELLEGTRSHIEGAYSQSRDRPFVEKRCTIFVITANTAGDELVDPIEGYDKEKYKEDVQMVHQKIIDAFSEKKKRDAEAFMSRLDAIIPYRGISDTAGSSLIDTYLEKYVQQGVLKQEDVAEVKAAIPKNLQDGRLLQKAVRHAVFTKVKEGL